MNQLTKVRNEAMTHNCKKCTPILTVTCVSYSIIIKKNVPRSIVYVERTNDEKDIRHGKLCKREERFMLIFHDLTIQKSRGH